MKRRITAIIGAICVTAAVAVAGDHDHKHAKVGEAAPDFTLPDLDGKEHKLSQYKGKYVVLEWTNPDCPFVKKHYDSKNMQKLQSAWVKKDVVWLTICSSAPGKQGYYEPSDIKSQMKKTQSSATAYLRDTGGAVGHMYQAKTTPHMYVIDPDGKLIYAGAIDDKPSTKKADIDGATNYVQACLEAATSGKAVATATSTPYGCSIKYAD